MNGERTEGGIQLLILIIVAAMAGAASFTHVHDWTMRNVPPGTGSWLGWANAVITELVPAAAGIETRRRKRQHRPVTYPMTILVADAVISIAVQLSDALHTLAGGVAFALPALAFLALTKLVLSRSRIAKENSSCAHPAPNPDAQTRGSVSPPAENSARVTATSGTSPTLPPAVPGSFSPAAPAPIASPSSAGPQPTPPAQLLTSARMTAFAHQQATGQPITAAVIAAQLGVPPSMAESLLEHLDGAPPPVTKVNGTVLDGSRP